VPDLNGNQLSAEALKQMSEQITERPVTVNFDPHAVVGRVPGTRTDEHNNLVVEGEVEDSDSRFKALEAAVGRRIFCVPGMTIAQMHVVPPVNKDGNEPVMRVIDKVSRVEYSLVDIPADPHLPPIVSKET